jgi:hypothetical protein
VRHYCTYFDHRYLPQGLALYQSMRTHIGNFRLWVLALDEECEHTLRRTRPERVEVVCLRELEQADPDFRASRQTRSLIEFYFTSTPCFLLHLLQQHSEIQRITYLDADTYFFASPARVEKEVDESSIAITPHRFRPELEEHRRYGIYNVGWLSFCRDPEGVACLARWREQCLQWCRDESEAGRFGDQGYLDEWPEKYEGVRVVNQPGFNEAPWNVEANKITKKNDKIFIGNQPLVLFHFQGLRRISPRLFNPNWHDYGLRTSRKLIREVYQPYLSTLLRAEAESGLSAKRQEFIRGQKNNTSLSLPGNIWGHIRAATKILNGNYLLARPCAPA